MEDFVRKTLLYDFYGELLTKHQQAIYEAVVFNDAGYSEVAAEEGISRQGVHDLVRRCDRQLENYESKLFLVEKFLSIQKDVRRIREKALEKGAPEIAAMADEILERL